MTKIIDTTIRDGGHLNAWDFDIAIIKDSYSIASQSGIDFFEIGYLSKLKYIPEPNPNTKIIAMIDIKDFKLSSLEKIENIAALRVAAYPCDIEKAFGSIDYIKDKGYDVFVNIMASSTLEEKDFNLLEKQKKSEIEALYFADTFGALYPNKVKKITQKLKDCSFKKLGFHAHNNLQLGFANAITAIECEIEYIDASAYGMGRGAGNLPIELILSFLNKDNSDYLELIKKHYLGLIQKYPWGYNLKHIITAQKNMHPSISMEL